MDFQLLCFPTFQFNLNKQTNIMKKDWPLFANFREVSVDSIRDCGFQRKANFNLVVNLCISGLGSQDSGFKIQYRIKLLQRIMKSLCFPDDGVQSPFKRISKIFIISCSVVKALISSLDVVSWLHYLVICYSHFFLLCHDYRITESAILQKVFGVIKPSL